MGRILHGVDDDVECGGIKPWPLLRPATWGIAPEERGIAPIGLGIAPMELGTVAEEHGIMPMKQWIKAKEEDRVVPNGNRQQMCMFMCVCV